jgi:DNA-binding NarL/FixJ family response regulator
LTPPNRILIAHGDPEARTELRNLAEDRLAVIGTVEASSFDSTIEQLRGDPGIELLIVDLDLPGMFWEVGLRHLLDQQDGLRIAVLLSNPDREKLHSLSANLMTLVPKHLPKQALADLVGKVIDGTQFASDSDEQSRPALPLPTPFDAPINGLPPLAPANDVQLTSRQIDVLRLLSEGYSNHEIASALAIAEGTVKVHVNAAFRILGVHNRVSAASAFRHYVEERLAHSVGSSGHH